MALKVIEYGVHRSPMTRPLAGLRTVAKRLVEAYDVHEAWWPVDAQYHNRAGSDARFEVMVGAILTQNTTWTNVERAVAALRERELLEPRRLARAKPGVVREAIRPAGYFNQKAAYLHALAARLAYKWKGDVAAFFDRPTTAIRNELLELRGIGDETADDILVYAAHRPVFIVDAYTRRLTKRLGLATGDEPYAVLQRQWARVLARRVKAYAEAHAAIVEHGKARCTAKMPACPGCPLEDACRKVGVGPEVYLDASG